MKTKQPQPPNKTPSEDDVLRRMLQTPPKKHAPLAESPKSAKKQARRK